MLITSHDILYLAIAISILTLTGFLSWTIYYAGRLLKNANSIVEEVHGKLSSILTMIADLSGKLEGVYRLVSALGGGVGNLVKKTVRRKTADWLGEDDAEEEMDEPIGRDTRKVVDEALRKNDRERRRSKF